MISLLRRLAPIVLIAAATVCGPFRPGADGPPAALVFTNETLNQADVFIVASGLGARRIGTVMAGRTDTLVVPAALARSGTLNVVARVLGRSARPQTGPVSISPGEQYQVRLTAGGRLLSFLPTPS